MIFDSNVKHLKIYGSRVFVGVPEALRKSKWVNKAQLGVLGGYFENSYRVLVNNKVITPSYVDVVEGNIKLICLENNGDNDAKDLDNYVIVELNETNNSVSNYLLSEYVALSEAVSELKYIKELLKVFKINLGEPVKVYEDNSSGIRV